MLTRFSVDPDALLSASEGEHKRLLRLWLRYGVLCHDSATFRESELFNVLPDLPQAVRKMWKTALSKAWLRPAPAEWRGWHSLEDRPDDASVLNGHMDLAGLEETRLEYLKDDLKEMCPNIEICLLADVDNTNAVEMCRCLSENPVHAEPIDDLWCKRFHEIAKEAQRITIVDPYALCTPGVAGVRYFLKKLSEEGGQKTRVSIFAAWFPSGPQQLSEEEAADRICQIRGQLKGQADGGGLGDIDLWLLDHHSYQRINQNRFLRFDHLVVDLGHGMRVFAGDLAEPMPCSIKLESSGYRQIIKALRSKTGSSITV